MQPLPSSYRIHSDVNSEHASAASTPQSADINQKLQELFSYWRNKMKKPRNRFDDLYDEPGEFKILSLAVKNNARLQTRPNPEPASFKTRTNAIHKTLHISLQKLLM